MLVADPWYDYLALPIGPIVLFMQFVALFVQIWWLRWGISAACFAAILVMLAYVASIPVGPDEGVNIGEGVLFLWLLCSLVLMLVLVAREVIVLAFRGLRRHLANRKVEPSASR